MNQLNAITKTLGLSALLLAACLATALPCVGQEVDGAQAGRIIAAVDAQKRYADSDFSCDLELTTTGAGTEKASSLRVFRRDGERKLAAFVLAPSSERGEGYLRLGENLWFFDAETGAYVHRVLSDAISDSEMESGDMEPDSVAESYSPTLLSEGRLGANEVLILDLEEKGVQAYSRMRVFVRKRDLILLKEEYLGSTGRLIRSVLYPAHALLGTRVVATRAIYVDGLDPSRRTTVCLGSPSFSPIDDKVFSKAFLERAR